MKRTLSILITMAMFFSLLSFASFASNYNSDYTRWSQLNSSDSNTYNYGCAIVALAIMIRDSGVETSSSSFNPDVFRDWEYANGYLNSNFYQTSWYSAQTYAARKGYTLQYSGLSYDVLNQVNSNIKNGYYSIISMNTQYGGHYALVNNIASAGGTIYCYNWGNPAASLWSFATSVSYVLTYNPVNTPNKPIAHSHSYSSSITTQPTCTKTGVRTYKCSCGASYTESVAALGHNYQTTTVPVTITSDGYTQKVCSRCKDTIKSDIVKAPVLNSDGWYYCDTLPSDATASKYTIQYNNYYEKTQTSSPGSGWTNAGVVSSSWVKSGNTYESYIPLETSDSRVLVNRYYYHYCGDTSYANYEWTGRTYYHFDSIPYSNATVRSSAPDPDNPDVTYYLLNKNSTGELYYCQSGDTCDGKSRTHGAVSAAWYLMNVYQDMVKVTNYKYTKNSGWVDSKDSSATSSKCRFKIKVSEYSVTYNANGGSGAPTAQTKYSDNKLTLSSTVPTRTGYTFLGWSASSTAASATYKAGGIYTDNKSVILYAVWKKNVSYGDVNGDGEIKLADAMMTFKYVAKTGALTSAQLIAADCNKDGYVKLADAMAIFKYVAKVTSSVVFK